MKTGGENSKKGYIVEENIKFIAEKLIENALNLHATDIHIEPRENHTLVRFRIHGNLQNFEKLPIIHSKKLAKYFKFLANLDFSEKNFTQISNIKYGKSNIRVSISPTFLGEKITLRVMSTKHKVRSLEEIGLWGNNLQQVRQILRQPSGVLITIGDGKNNTNFSILNDMISDEKNIVTVEKHIEKAIPEINQIEVKERIGINYTQATSAAFSQNPDVVLVDDLRDSKTAQIIFNEANRGKFIILSLPVQKISDVIPYLEFLGVPNFLISTSLLGIVSQKLIRTTSPKAIKFEKISKKESQALLNQLKINPMILNNVEKTAKEYFDNFKIKTTQESIIEIPTINESIGDSGFIGVTAIFEVISLVNGKFGRDFKNLINSNPNSAEIEDFLEDSNFSNLKIDGIIKALQGKTTIKEVISRTGY